MYLVAIAWIYVVLMMAVAEAQSSQGTVLGAIITFVLYGLLPLSIVLYILGAPARRQRIVAREKQEFETIKAAASDQAASAADATQTATPDPALASSGQDKSS